MPLTINTKTFTADSFGKDRIGYSGPDKTGSTKDDLSLARTAAKPTAVFSGVQRTSAKLVRTMTLTGALTPSHDAIMELPVSVPIGASDVDVTAMVADFAGFVSSAEFLSHVLTQKNAF